jgi:nuclear pore complex protein Nup133
LDLALSASPNFRTLFQPKTYIASTSTGRLFRLALTSAGGKQHIAHFPFSHNQGNGRGLGRLIPGLWSSSVGVVPHPGNVNAVALSPSTSDLWALVDTRVQKFSMSAEGWEEIIMDEDLAGIVRPAIREKFNSAPDDDRSMDLELLDLTVEMYE